MCSFFFFQAEDGIRDDLVTGVQTCALPILLTEAFGMIARGPEAQRVRLGLELAQAAGAAGMIAGQVLDIAEDRPAEEAYLFRLHLLKTGALIRAACRMGVIATGSNDDALAAADADGQAGGVAFPSGDDLLGLNRQFARVGEPTRARAAPPPLPFA